MRWSGKIGVVLKSILFFFILIAIVFFIAHLAIEFGVQAGEIQQFLSRTWFLWILIRFAIYGFSGYFLYQLQHKARDEQEKTAYKKLTRAFIIGLAVIEMVILVQVIRG